MTIYAKPGNIFVREHDGFRMGETVSLGYDYSTGVKRLDLPEYYREELDTMETVNISKVALLEALGRIGLRDAMLAAIGSDPDTKLFFDQSVVVEWADPRVQAMIGFLKSVGLTDEQETAIYHGCRSPVMFRDDQ